MNVTVWYSSESMADYIIDHTVLKSHFCVKKRLKESDASKPSDFHAVPDHIKKILYLDAPDIIVEAGSNPIFTIEESKEAGTGHNAFQRFSRLAASAENGIPSFYIYPEAVIIQRKNSPAKWDVINPLVFHALDRLMSVFGTPALLFFYPSHYREGSAVGFGNKGLKLCEGQPRYLSCPSVDGEMKSLFSCIDKVVDEVSGKGLGALFNLMGLGLFKNRRDWQLKYYYEHLAERSNWDMSPLTSVREVPTEVIAEYIRNTANVNDVGDLLSSRKKTMVYCVDASFRGDPYPGALSAIDYMLCRIGKTFEDREMNLVMVWGRLDIEGGVAKITGASSVEDFCARVKSVEQHNLLTKSYRDVCAEGRIPRYYMQARYGSMFSKAKDIRVYSYFCDAILFHDGALWREG